MMALGIYGIIAMVFIITALIIQALLYRTKNEAANGIFIVNMVFGVVFAYITFSSLPSNFIGQKILTIVWAIIAVAGLLLKLKDKKFMMISKIMLSVAIIGSLVQLFM